MIRTGRGVFSALAMLACLAMGGGAVANESSAVLLQGRLEDLVAGKFASAHDAFRAASEADSDDGDAWYLSVWPEKS